VRAACAREDTACDGRGDFFLTQGRGQSATFGQMARGRVSDHFTEEEFLNSYGSTYPQVAVVPRSSLAGVAGDRMCVLLSRLGLATITLECQAASRKKKHRPHRYCYHSWRLAIYYGYPSL